MKARRIIFLLTIIFLFTFTSLPHSGPKPLYADDPPATFTVRCAVIFPYACLIPPSFDTGISIAGDSTSLGEGEIPKVKLYFYNSSGNLIHTITDQKAVKSENSQWGWLLNQCGLPQQELPFLGFVVALTNIPYVESACFIGDLNAGSTCDAPVVIDYSITNVDQNGHLVRSAAYTPPQNWAALDPAEGEIDPALHHTTLVFPYVSNIPGIDTGISITNTFDATGVQNRSVSFYLYESDGSLWGKGTIPLTGGSGVSPMYSKLLSEILGYLQREPGQGDFSGTGYLVAHVNIPFAEGYSVVVYGGACYNAAASAKVENDIYDFAYNVPQWVGRQDENHTSIIVPIVETFIPGEWTGVTLINTVQVLDEFYLPRDVTAHFYLYNMDGNLAVDWPETMTSSGELTEMLQVKFDVNGITVNGEFVNLYPFVVMGWLLIIVDAPGAEAMLIIGDTNNALSMTRADTDNDIIGVSEEEDHVGEIIRANPPPADAGDSWSIPLASAQSGWATYPVTVNTRNASEWEGDAQFTYKGWKFDGESLLPQTEEVEVSGTLLPSHPFDVGQIQGFGGTYGRLKVSTPTSCTHGVVGYYTPSPSDDRILISQPEIVRTTRVAVPVDIWDGQVDHSQNPPPAPISRSEHLSRGAISIANRNDSDADTVVDYADTNGVPGEKDLMKMVIYRPEPAHLKGWVRLWCWRDAEITLWKSADKSNGEAPWEYKIETTQWPVTVWIEGAEASEKVRGHAVRTSYHADYARWKLGHQADKTYLTFYWAEKIKLGGSGTTEKPQCTVAKIYIPTKYGGTFTLTPSAGQVELYYVDGSDVTLQNWNEVVAAEHKVAVAAGPLDYEVPANKHGWYAVRLVGADIADISNTFIQDVCISRMKVEDPPNTDNDVWNSWYWSWKDEVNPNMYDDDSVLEKYDEFTDQVSEDERVSAKKWERVHHISDIGWYGFCHAWSNAAYMVAKPVPSAGYYFSIDEAKALAFLPYDVISNKRYEIFYWVTDNTNGASRFHYMLEEYVKKRDTCVDGNLYAHDPDNIDEHGVDTDAVWNYPVFAYRSDYSEAEGDSETKIDVRTYLKSAKDGVSPASGDPETAGARRHPSVLRQIYLYL